MMNKLMLNAIPFGLIIIIISFQYNKIEKLNEELTNQQILTKEYLDTSKALGESLDNINKEFDNYIVDVDDLNKSFEEFRNEVKEIEKKFSEHDFTNLINEKPKLVENIINKGTSDFYDEIEEITKMRE